MANCKSCKAPLKWILTPTGKKMPLDDKIKTFYIIDKEGYPHLFKGYEPHWGNCPGANKFKKEKR